MPTFTGTQKMKGGTLSYGERDPLTGTRYEEFTPDPVAAAVAAPKPNAGDIYKGLIPDTDKTQDDAYADYENILKLQNQPVDENDIRAKTMERFQAEIDALNQVYAEKKAEERVRGEGRLGSSAAIQARRGLLGSDFGGAQTEKVSDYNQSIQDSIDAEKASKISSILSTVRKDASDEIAAKTAARKAGAQEYITYLAGAAERKTARVSDTVKNVLLNQIEADDNLFKELATMLGVSTQVVKAQYEEQKAAQAGEVEKPVVVAPGSSIFDPVTGKFIGTAPDKPADNKPITAEVGDTLLQYDSKTGSWKSIYTAPSSGSSNQKIVKIDGVDYVQNEDGSFTKPTLPDAVPSAEKVQKATEVISSIDAILNNADLSKAIGPRSSAVPEILRSGARNDVEAAIKALIAGVAIENLSLLKGPMSDKDVAFIKEASSGLNTNMSEEGFKARLTQLKNKFQEIKDRAATENQGDDIDSFLESFNQPLSMGVNGSTVSGIPDGSRVKTVIGEGIATGIQNGSSKWKWGYDFVLNGGKGANVPAPFNGTVVFAGMNKGFGNQVKVRLSDGSEIWLSHLDALNVKPGQKITKGTIIGKQGNTGALLSSSGRELTPQQIASGRGTHLDITVKKSDGKYMTSKQVAELLKTSKLT